MKTKRLTHLPPDVRYSLGREASSVDLEPTLGQSDGKPLAESAVTAGDEHRLALLDRLVEQAAQSRGKSVTTEATAFKYCPPTPPLTYHKM